VGSVWATTGHRFADEFGLSAGAVGVGVAASSGDVVTLDSDGAPPRVERFDGAGGALGSFPIAGGYRPSAGVGVGTDGSVYALAYGGDAGAPAGVLRYPASGNPSGTPLGVIDGVAAGLGINFFDCPAGPAVDPMDGSVWVAANDGVAQVIAHFDGGDGSFIGSFSGTGSPQGGLACPSGLAVDNAHQVYVLDGGHVDRYSDLGVFGARIDDGSANNRGPPDAPASPVAVATDPVSGEVYVAETGVAGLMVTQFGTNGDSVLNTFDASNVHGVKGMAVSATGTVYMADATDAVVERFVPFAGPTVTTDPQSTTPTSDPRSATLIGSIIPEGASSYHFEYGTEPGRYGSKTPEVDVGSGSSAVAASATIDHLRPNTGYHYRIVGRNGSGSIVGADQSLTTAAAPATVDPSPPFASAITPRSARLFGSINPNSNGPTSWSIEYGTSTAYGSSVFLGICFLCDGADVPMVASVSGLEPGTLYHFRVVANDPFGPQQGVDKTFITAPGAAAGAIDVTARRATLRGTIDAHGVATTYHFDYGTTTSYGSSTPEVDGGAGDGEGLVSQAITGLAPLTTYHVQLVATSADGVVRSGGDGLFTTPPAPTAAAPYTSGVSTSAATLNGTATTFGAVGSYHFELSALDGSYTTVTDERALAATAGPQPVSVGVSGLPAGKTFSIQLVVSANEAREYSDLIIFATAPVPLVAPIGPDVDPTSVVGCGAPHIDSYDKRPAPGEVITITGQDLGLSGTVVLGDESFTPTEWSQRGFKVRIPDEAEGTLALTASCGRVSNTIAVAVFREPDNRFSVPTRSVKGATARLVVRVPGPGKIEITGARITKSKTMVKKAGGEITIIARLNAAGARALKKAKSHKLRVGVGVRFTPAGGKPAAKSLTVTFQRKAGR
jgi:hypothetical protein